MAFDSHTNTYPTDYTSIKADVLSYLTRLAPTVKLFKDNFTTSNQMLDEFVKNNQNMILVNKLKTQNAENTSTEGLIVNSPPSKFIYLTEVYLYFFGNNNNKLANIHDGWALARILEWNGTNLVDFTNINPGTAETQNYNFNELNITQDNYDTILKRANNIKIELSETDVGFPYNFSCRGDQLSMFVEFYKIKTSIQDYDRPFSAFIQEHSSDFEPMAAQLKMILSSSNGGKRKKTNRKSRRNRKN